MAKRIQIRKDYKVKYYYKLTDDGWCAQICPFYDDNALNQVLVGSATCCEDCKHIINYNIAEGYVICKEITKMMREEKLKRIMKWKN